jgi:hypothetical protein
MQYQRGWTSSLQPLSSIKAPSLQGEISLSWCRPNTFRIVGSYSLGAYLYWKLIGLELRLQKHIHIYKGIWTMFGVRWSSALLVLPSLLSSFPWFSTNIQYGITLIPLGPTLWYYSNLIVFHVSSITFLLITSNLMLYLLQLLLVLHLYWLRAI